MPLRSIVLRSGSETTQEVQDDFPGRSNAIYGSRRKLFVSDSAAFVISKLALACTLLSTRVPNLPPGYRV